MSLELAGQQWIVAMVQPPGAVHSHALLDCAETFVHGLRALGADARFGSPLAPCDHALVFGAHMLTPDFELPAHCILYNLEQLVDWSNFPNIAHYFERLARHEVWDYSDVNVELLRARGLTRVKRVLLGYMPQQSRIPKAKQDIDVLFYGTRNARRDQVLQQLAAKGLRVGSLESAYGKQRDTYIARAKLVLNIHFYPSGTFEIARVSHLLANRKAVVCEHSVMNDDDLPLQGGMAYVPYDELVATCVRLVGDEAERQRLEQRGFELFSNRSQADILRQALGSEPQPVVASA